MKQWNGEKHGWFDSTPLPCSSEKLMVRAALSIILPCWAAISSFSVWVRVRPTMLFFLDGECLSAATNQHKQVMYCTNTKFLYCHLEIRSQVRDNSKDANNVFLCNDFLLCRSTERRAPGCSTEPVSCLQKIQCWNKKWHTGTQVTPL